jgi:uncharacterized protein with PQ loop repeat
MTSSSCIDLTPFQFELGYFLVVASILLAYMPQWIKIIRQRSHAGLSLENFCCAAFSTLLSLLSILAGTANDVVSCCRTDATHACMATAQPLIQQVVTTISAHLVVLFYFLNFSPDWCHKQGRDPAPEWAFTKRVCSILIALGCLCSLVCGALFLAPHQRGLRQYGQGIGILNGLLISCHWGFQIRETHVAKCAGSLSLFAIFNMFGGSFLVST